MCRTTVDAVLSDVGGPAVRRLVFMRRRGGRGMIDRRREGGREGKVGSLALCR